MTDTPTPEPTQVDIAPRPVEGGRLGRRIAAVVGAVALVGGGAFAVNALAADGNNPEDPVRALIEAAAQGDVIGMLEELAPGERDAVREPLEDIVDELERLEILDDVDLGNLEAYDLEVSDLEFESERVGDDLAYVQLRNGTADYSFDPADLPIGSFLEDVLGVDLSGEEPETGTEELGDRDASIDEGLVTIERDGRWYVSIGHTIAEQARRDAGVALEDLEGVDPEGAESAEAAVEAMVEAGAALDARRLISLLPPGEMGALQAYAGLFLGDLDAALDEVPADFEVTIDSLELSSEVDGDRATVKVDSVELTVVADGATYQVVDGCVLFEQPGRAPERACLDDPEALGGFFGLPGFGISGDLDVDEPAEGELPDVGITVVQVDGKWFVSPIRTALDSMVASLAALERSDLETLVGQAMTGFAQSFGAMTGGSEGGWQSYVPEESTTPTTFRVGNY